MSKITVTRQATPKTEAPVSPASESSAPFRLVRSETLMLDRARAVAAARAHRELPASPTERDFDPKRLERLVDAIREQRLLACNWVTVTYDGVKYRANGMHSSEALQQEADNLPSLVSIHLDHFEVDDAVGMGILFRQFDARWSSRSKQDICGAYQGLVPGLNGIDKARAKLGIEGICWYDRILEKVPTPSGDNQYEKLLLDVYHPFIRWLNGILSLKTPELKKAPIVGAMYHTFITSESGAQDFWPHVAKGDLVDDSDPRSVLAADLLSIKEQKKSDEPCGPGEFYAKCIKAWNAFRAGEKIHSLRVNIKKGFPQIAA